MSSLMGGFAFVDSVPTRGTTFASPQDTAFATVGGTRYMVSVAGGVQAFEVADAGTLSFVSEVLDSAGTDFASPREVVTVQRAGNTYVYVAGFDDALVGFTLDGTGTLTRITGAGGTIQDDATTALDITRGLAAVRIGGADFVIATGQQDSGISIFQVADDGRLSLAQSLFGLTTPGAFLSSPTSVEVVQVGGKTFAFTVASQGLTSFEVAANGTATVIEDYPRFPWTNGEGSADIATASAYGTHFLFVSPIDDEALFVYEVAPDGTLSTFASIETDPEERFRSAGELTPFVVDGALYLFSASERNDEIYLIGVGEDGSLTDLAVENDVIRLFQPFTTEVLQTDEGVFGMVSGDGQFNTYSIGEGLDALIGGAGADRAVGLGGDDDLVGREGNDSLFGGGGNDVLSGGTGNDLLQGGDGADVVSGGLGNDTLVGDAGDDVLVGGDGEDTASFEDAAEGLVINLGNGTARGSTERDLLETIEHIVASGFGDSILGDGGTNTLTGGDGDDSIDGRSSIDVIYGGEGADTLIGERGADCLYGGEADDVLYGGALRDRLDGGSGNDTFFGGDGKDLVFGGAGNDLIVDGLGGDIYRGGAGEDTFVYDTIVAAETIFGFTGGVDKIDLSNNAEYQDFNDVQADLVVDGDLELRAASGTIEFIGLTAVGDLSSGDFIF